MGKSFEDRMLLVSDVLDDDRDGDDASLEAAVGSGRKSPAPAARMTMSNSVFSRSNHSLGTTEGSVSIHCAV